MTLRTDVVIEDLDANEAIVSALEAIDALELAYEAILVRLDKLEADPMDDMP